MPQEVLLIDDDPAFRNTAARLLDDEGFRALHAADGGEGVSVARERRPGLVILDLRLPGMQGLEVCKTLKGDEETAGIPLLVLTAYDRDGQDVACLDLGADSYLTKPVRGERLLAHCRALLRRGSARGAAARGPLRLGGLALDYQRKVARLGGREFAQLTPKEFELLYFLASRSPDPFDRETLYREVWDAEPPHEGALKTVEVHIRRLRLKLGLKPEEWLLRVTGRGYCLRPPC